MSKMQRGATLKVNECELCSKFETPGWRHAPEASTHEARTWRGHVVPQGAGPALTTPGSEYKVRSAAPQVWADGIRRCG